MKRIAVICARGGSKGVPRKNVRELAGKPLIAWTIEHALASHMFDEVAVSSDDAEILDAARDAGATQIVQRPTDLATDEVSVHPSIVHCVETVEARLDVSFGVIVLLQATSPFRTPSDISDAIRLREETGAGSVISATPSQHSPYFSMVEEDQDGSIRISKPLSTPFPRRQDAPDSFDLNGSIYVFDRDAYLSDPKGLYEDTRLYKMPEERSLDIDTKYDWEIACALAPGRLRGANA